MVTLTESRLLSIYVAISAGLVGAITFFQYSRYNLFGTSLLLGWDSPRYVWAANEVLAQGPLYLIRNGGYPYLYVQLLALLGYLFGNVVFIERVLPLVFATVLIYADAKITLRITKSIHIAGLAAVLAAVSINTLRLYADLNRNLMVLSLSFVSFLLISDLFDKASISKRLFLSKTYLSVIVIFLVIAGTQLETFFVLALTIVLVGVFSRNWRKLAALTAIPAIPAVILLMAFPQLPLRYLNQIGLFTGELYLDEVILWAGGSWFLLGFLVVGVAYMFYHAIRQKSTLASAILSWTGVIGLLVILTTQRVISLSAEYALRALFILPLPILFASAVFGVGSFLRETFLEVGVSSLVKRCSVRISVKHVALVVTTLILVTGSVAVTLQHYDDFLTPYVARSAYDKIQVAGSFLKDNGYSEPIVVFYGGDAHWYGNLYSNYLGARIGSHYSYRGDIGGLLHFSLGGSQYYQRAVFASPILIITPYLYDKEIPYYLTRFHVGQGVYVIPPGFLISRDVGFGSVVTVTTDDGISEIRSEYVYADQEDPLLIALRVAAKGYTSYTFGNYPQDWAFLRLEQGGVLSYPEKDPRRFDGTIASVGNDPAESVYDWGSLQIAAVSVESLVPKEGEAYLRVEGCADSWGNLGARYNSQGTWDLSHQFSLAVWAKASESRSFSVTLSDVFGNTRTFWDIRPDGVSATAEWKRFVVELGNYTGQNGSFDLSRVDSVDFYVYSTPGRVLTLWIDDPIVDEALTLGGTVFKGRVPAEERVALYFLARLG
jgi:hypothetical protein